MYAMKFAACFSLLFVGIAGMASASTCSLLKTDAEAGLYIQHKDCVGSRLCRITRHSKFSLKRNFVYHLAYKSSNTQTRGLIRIRKKISFPVTSKNIDKYDWEDDYVYVRRDSVSFVCRGSRNRLISKEPFPLIGYHKSKSSAYDLYHAFDDGKLTRKQRKIFRKKFHVKYLTVGKGGKKAICVQSDDKLRRFVFAERNRYWPNITKIRRALIVASSLVSDTTSKAIAKEAVAKLVDQRSEVDIKQYRPGGHRSCASFTFQAKGTKLTIKIDDLEVAAANVKNITEMLSDDRERLDYYDKNFSTKVKFSVEN